MLLNSDQPEIREDIIRTVKTARIISQLSPKYSMVSTQTALMQDFRILAAKPKIRQQTKSSVLQRQLPSTGKQLHFAKFSTYTDQRQRHALLQTQSQRRHKKTVKLSTVQFSLLDVLKSRF